MGEICPKITPAEYKSLLAKQGGVCAICQRRPKTIKLAVDHDHLTGKVRGLLCGNCNTSLGKLGDTEETLAVACRYLRKTTDVRHTTDGTFLLTSWNDYGRLGAMGTQTTRKKNDPREPHVLSRVVKQNTERFAVCSCGNFTEYIADEQPHTLMKISGAFAGHVMAARELVEA